MYVIDISKIAHETCRQHPELVKRKLLIFDGQLLVGQEDAGIAMQEMILDKIDNEVRAHKVVKLDFTGIKYGNVALLFSLTYDLQSLLYTRNDKMLVIANAEKWLEMEIQAAILHGDQMARLYAREQSRVEKKKVLPKQLAILYKNDGYSRFQMAGEIEPAVADAFEFLRVRRRVTPAQYAAYEKIPLNNACNRLRRLYELRLADRHQKVDAPGRPLIYFLPKVDHNPLWDEIEIDET